MRALWLTCVCVLVLGCEPKGGSGGGGGEGGGGGDGGSSEPAPPGCGGASSGGSSGSTSSGDPCEPACGCRIGTACYAGTSPQRCGSNGDACLACPAGQGCSGGSCAKLPDECEAGDECDDEDPCTDDVCGDGQCFHFPVVPQACEGDGWCNVGAMGCEDKTECCHGCLLMEGDHFACVPQDGCPSPSFCSGDGLCVL